MDVKPCWQKKLYLKQDYPDNYVDQTFLDELKKNHGVQIYSYATLVSGSTVITQQLCCVVLFVVLYLYMRDQSLSAEVLWILMSAITTVCYVLNIIVCSLDGSKLSLDTFGKNMKTCLMFQGLSAMLSPVLVSLTETISTDTIYAMTTIMLLGNLLFFNYDTTEDFVPGTLSLNAAIFASVCLASRLHTTWHAFTTVTSAFELFALWPYLRQKIMVKYPLLHKCLTFAVILVCAVCLGFKTGVGAFLYCLLVLLITFVFPAWFYSLQAIKNNISGPWDEAGIHSS